MTAYVLHRTRSGPDGIINYLKQASTWRGLIAVAVAAGLVHLSQEAQDSIVGSALALVALGESLKGTINILRNDKK